MPTSVPAGVPSDGFVKVAWVEALANPAAVKLTELSSATTVDATCYLTAFEPTAEANAIEDARLCSKQIFEDYGTVTYSIGDLVYVYDAQTPASESNKLYAALTAGKKGFLVVAWGKDADTAWKIGDIVDVYPVKLGPQVKQPPEANSKLKVGQKPFVTGPVQQDKAVVA